MMNKPLKILVVEDQIITSESIKVTLQNAGHQVVETARSYNEALLAAVKFKPDVIIMDIELAGSAQDGIRAAADIRNVFHVAIVFLTGREDPETFRRASQMDPEGYLLKPFKPGDLINQVSLAWSRLNSTATSPDDIYVWDEGSHIKIKRSDVIFMEAKRVWTNIYSVRKSKPLLVTMNLGHISRHFPEANFFRLSKSILINLDFLQKVKDNQLFFDGTKEVLNVSDQKKAELKRHLTIVRSPRSVKQDEEAGACTKQ